MSTFTAVWAAFETSPKVTSSKVIKINVEILPGVLVTLVPGKEEQLKFTDPNPGHLGRKKKIQLAFVI